MPAGIWILAAMLFGVFVVRRVVSGYPAAPPTLQALAAREIATLQAITEVFYPPGHGVSPSGSEAGVTAYIDRFLGEGQPRQARLIHALLFLIEHATLCFPVWSAGLGAFRRLSSHDLASREVYLHGWASSRWFLRRLCFTSIRALCTLGYFNDATVLRELGLAPRAIEPRIVEADLLYPRVGQPRTTIPFDSTDLTTDWERPPLGVAGPLAPGYEATE